MARLGIATLAKQKPMSLEDMRAQSQRLKKPQKTENKDHSVNILLVTNHGKRQ
jgi:hypothetical protein